MSFAVGDSQPRYQPSIIQPGGDSPPATAEGARVGLLADFYGSFLNTLKSQGNGAIQLANRLGANLDETKLAKVDAADFGSAAWAAELAGQAGAMSLELFGARRVGAVARLLMGRGSLVTALSETVPASTKLASNIGFGAFAGGVLTPTEGTGSFWSDRFKNAFTSATAFGAMGGISAALERQAVGLGSGALASTLRNGYFNNAVGGFFGGTAGDVMASALNGQLPGAAPDYWQHVGRAGAEFALVGLGVHSLDAGVARMRRAPAEQSQTAGDAPDRSRLFPLDGGADRFVGKIVEKYRVSAIDESQLSSIIDTFPEQQRALATKILEHSLPNSSEALFTDRMKTLRSRLEAKLAEDGFENSSQFVSVDNAGWGKAFGYLYRKLSGLEGKVYSADPAALRESTRAAVVLDDPATARFSPEQIEALRKLDKVYVVAPSGFERGLNFFDYARGPVAVSAKLHELTAQVGGLRAKEPALTDEALIDRVINADAGSNAQRWNDRVEIVDAGDRMALGIGDGTGTIVGIADVLNRSRVTEERVRTFLQTFVPDNQQPAAYLLAEGGKHVSYGDMFKYIDSLAGSIDAARGTRVEPQRLLFHSPDVNDSVDLINYMYRLSRGVPRERFVAKPALERMANSGELSEYGVVFLDDHIMTGDKIGKRFNGVRSSVEQSDGVYFAAMLRDGSPIFGEWGEPSVPYEVLSAERVAPFHPQKWDGATNDQLLKARDYATDSGFVTGEFGDPRVDFLYPTISSNATITWPFAMPDNDVTVIRRFGHHVLGLRQTRDPLLRELDDRVKHHVPSTIPPVERPVEVWQPGRLSPEFLELQSAVAMLHGELNLTPVYPRVAAAASGGEASVPTARATDSGTQGTSGVRLAEALYRMSGERLSENWLREMGDTPPAILRSDPDLRLAVERAIVERMLLGAANSKPLQLGTAADGSLYAHNGIALRMDDGAAPLWQGVEAGIRSEFERTELSDDTYNRLRHAYERIGAAPWFNANPAFDGVRQRLEWLLEHGRFPSATETTPVIF